MLPEAEMIKENQRLLNQLNVLSDGAIVFLSMLIGYWIRFYVFVGSISVGLSITIYFAIAAAVMSMLIFAVLGLYESFRVSILQREISRLFGGMLLVTLLLLAALFLMHMDNASRWHLAIFFSTAMMLLCGKRLTLRGILSKLRETGFNQKHVLIVGSGPMAEHYFEEITRHKTFGFHPLGYVSDSLDLHDVEHLGDYSSLERVLEATHPDEVVVAISDTDYSKMPVIIDACEKNGTKLSLIPFYALYMPANPQIDNLGGIPMINLRRIPLDNFGNAFIKRAVDITGSFLLLLVLSPLMLITALGVKLSSPGPVVFKQERVGLNKKIFKMYKFRSMRANGKETCGWSTNMDERRTRFGSFIRKFSIDELPQLYNVLIGSMSLVGPRPEVPFFVGQFKEEVPRYMVKHQVRPGITGWAQVNGLRGDTSILERVNHDIYYIENWTPLLDIKILFMTLFKFVNKETLRSTADEAQVSRS